MANWISITPEDLSVGKAAPLLESLRSLLLADGQDDPAAEVIADVVSVIRTEIKGCRTNQLDADPAKIPAELKSLAVRMIIRQLQSRLNVGGALPLTEDDKEEQRRDDRRLERIARCEIPVSTPDDAISGEVQVSSPAPRITPRPLNFRNQDGI